MKKTNSVSDFLKKRLLEAGFNFAGSIKDKDKTKGIIVGNHSYVVLGFDWANNENLIHLNNPHGKDDYSSRYSVNSDCWKPRQKEPVGYKEEGHIWFPDANFSFYFDSKYSIYPKI